MERLRLIAGTMSGTSLDGLDAALVEVRGTGLDLRARLLGSISAPLGAVGGVLRRLASGEAVTAGAIAAAARAFAAVHVDLVRRLCDGRRIDLAAVHGQTVFHAPPLSWQLVDAPAIAQGLGCPVVCDLRAADLCAGGQGAPITPLADLLVFGREGERRGVVNLGGFINATLLPADRQPGSVQGRDVCACNQFLDLLARRLLGRDYDEDGAVAARGTALPEWTARWSARLRAQAAAGRSLGSADAPDAWVADLPGDVEASDLLASGLAAVAEVLGEVLAPWRCQRVLLAGGGARNAALVSAVAARLRPAAVETTAAYGVGVHEREAMAMAVLGALCHDRTPITLPQVTGAVRPAIAGTWVTP